MSEDNWKHRSSGMVCGTCMYFVQKEVGELKPANSIDTDNSDRGYLGRCRANAPTMKGFPAVFSSDWCGNHKIDENKI